MPSNPLRKRKKVEKEEEGGRKSSLQAERTSHYSHIPYEKVLCVAVKAVFPSLFPVGLWLILRVEEQAHRPTVLNIPD